MSDNDASYQFGSGIGDDEVARLEVQGAAYAQATRMIFAEASIRPGMRVLDLGCGGQATGPGPNARGEPRQLPRWLLDLGAVRFAYDRSRPSIYQQRLA